MVGREKGWHNTGRAAVDDSHVFTMEEVTKRFDAIVGKTVAEVDCAGVLDAPNAGKNKGRIGAVIEQSVLGYSADSDQRPDIVVDGEEWEIKATGLKLLSRGDTPWNAKEPMSVTAVSDAIVEETFGTSAFWHKARHLLIVYYLYLKPGKGLRAEYATFEFKGYDFHLWKPVDRARLETDWLTVQEHVSKALQGDYEQLMPELSTSVNPNLLYIDTSPKYPNRPRFRLKASVVTQMACERIDDDLGMIPDDREITSMARFDAKLRAMQERMSARNLTAIADACGISSGNRSEGENKALAEQCMVHLFTGKRGRISKVPIFAKAGFSFQTVTLTPEGGRTEDVKLCPSIDFDELCDPDALFEESLFAAPFIDRTVIIAVFKEVFPGCELHSCVFCGFKKLWLGVYLDAARQLWSDMRELVFSNKLREIPLCKKDGTPRITPKTKIRMTAVNWPKSKDGVLFIRGTGADGNDKAVEVNGIRMYRQNVWVKGTEIAKQLADIPYI